ncbi:hypothetical protein CP082626L3_1518A, partial [Chlamydia psittaci 08-2626_L3]
MMIWH